MTDTTLTSAKAWSPDAQGFIPNEVVPDALILQTANVVGTIEGDEPAVRVPWVDDDGTAAFIPEGTDIPEGSGTLTETIVTTGKVATLAKFSREQLTQPGAAEMIVSAMSRSVIAHADRAYLGNAGGPTGLLNVVGITDGGTLGADLDALADALTHIESAGGTATHIVAHPSAWSSVSKLKTSTGSASPLLGAGTEATERRVLGVPVLTTAAMPEGQLLVIDQSTILAAVGSVYVDRSEHAYFAADTIGVRVTFRLGWAAMKPDLIVKIATEPAV